MNEKSLAYKHPEIAKEWDSEKNDDMTSEDVTYGSSKIVWWKCKNGHGWEQKIYNRTFANKRG